MKHQSPTRLEQDAKDVDELISTKGLSAYQVQEKRNLQKGKKKESVKVQNETKDSVQHTQNPVRVLQDAARKLGVSGLSKR